MKYGLMVHRECVNLGDDIQSYAESLFLPRIDYLVDREHINTFVPSKKADINEPVATIMGAWWMHRKWNFPPSKYIYPLWISTHITNDDAFITGTPLFDEFIEGIGGDYLRAYAPIGARDLATVKTYENQNIPAYFSGCVTLTLPKQKKKKLKKEYILLVDLDPRVEQKIYDSVDTDKFDIKKVSNIRTARRNDAEMDNWEFRKKEVLELLSLYQNASCVVTTRLHVSLPCLAMEVPVLCVFDKDTRFEPYDEWLHLVSVDDFLNDKANYDICSPPANKGLHLETREKLKETINTFIAKSKDEKATVDELVRTTYTDEEVQAWRNKLMQTALDRWWPISKKKSHRIRKLDAKNNALKAKNAALRKSLQMTRERLADLESSRSWRLTKGLREAAKPIRKILGK